MDKKNSKGIVPGIILIGVGLIFILNNFNIDIGDFLVLGLGMIFIIAYLTKKKMGFLITGIILSYVGSMIFLKNALLMSRQLSGSLFLVGIGAVFLTIYFLKKKQWFIFPGFILPAVGASGIMVELTGNSNKFTWPLLFMFIAVAFLIIFTLEYRRLGYRPLVAALMFFITGVFAFLTVTGVIGYNIWRNVLNTSRDFWPFLLIAAGVVIIYKNINKKSNNDT